MSALFGDIQRQAMSDAVSCVGQCVRVSPCDADTYETRGIYWTEPVTLYDGNDVEYSDHRHLLQMSLNDIDGRISNGDQVVIDDRLFRINRPVDSDGIAVTYQLHMADDRGRV